MNVTECRNIHNVGFLFPNFFPSDTDYFSLLTQQHNFQSLTESNKPGCSFRKGIYLSKVGRHNDNDLIFNLLRCSTNLDGPTENFRDVDNDIISRVNAVASKLFPQPINFNHVLAQVYQNTVHGKAKIKKHSDKTKDMPDELEAGIAFCTFYNFTETKGLKPSASDPFDICHKKTSALTKLRFRLKECVVDASLAKEFDATLYPNSLLIIPLKTNRLYTHEIVPSVLQFDMIPTRLGYVIRCSKTKALYRDNQTYIDNNGIWVPLRPITEDDRNHLRNLYYVENTSDKVIDYGFIDFSMNDGDNMKPLI